MSKSVTRLYEQFHPEHYDINIQLDPDTMTFKGDVVIRGRKVGRPSKRLTFHQKGLKIDQVTVHRSDKKDPKPCAIARVNKQDSFDEVRLHSDEMLYPGEYTISVSYSGVITRNMDGIYPCFFDKDGVEQKLIATQFESHHAREAFPCIDEPEAKSTFSLVLNTPNKGVTLSNTPLVGTRISDDKLRRISEFDITPKMSTYLLAFIHGELEYTEATTKDGVVVRCYATPTNVQFTNFALDCAVKTLEFYNEYFDIAYPLPKCDFIALPDFASGAMENWGCITFREQALLVDPANTSLHLKQYVANVVAHELTHQWFGNLVTMRWWTDLWLNESFASWMSYLAVDHLFPDWDVWTQFIVDEQALALKQDALEHTHPIEVTVHHPDEIRTIFDVISYEKGASVLLMLHDYLGAEQFRNGLRVYLKRHAYGNTDTVDLWAALEETSDKPVREFMNDWITQSGYPIVKANVQDEHESLTQERFYVNESADKESAVWPIPLAQHGGLTITKPKSEISLTGPLSGEPILNPGHTSFCRVIYNKEHLAKLAKQIPGMSVLDRMSLLADASEAAKGGYESTVDALRLLPSYANEDSPIVWDIIADCIGGIRLVMEDDAVRDALKPLLRDVTALQLARLGWDEQPADSHFDLLLRPTILGLASFAEVPSVVNEAKKRFETMTKPEDIHPDIRGVIYGTIARIGGKQEFEKLLAMHNSSTNSEERVTLAASLTHFKQPELIDRALAEITGKNVRLQDAPFWIGYSFANRHARRTTWKWLQANWDWLATNLGSDLSFFRMPIYASRGFSDADFIPEFKAFFEAHMSPAFERPVNQAIETIQWHAAWKTRDLVAIRDYLTSL